MLQIQQLQNIIFPEKQTILGKNSSIKYRKTLDKDIFETHTKANTKNVSFKETSQSEGNSNSNIIASDVTSEELKNGYSVDKLTIQLNKKARNALKRNGQYVIDYKSFSIHITKTDEDKYAISRIEKQEDVQNEAQIDVDSIMQAFQESDTDLFNQVKTDYENGNITKNNLLVMSDMLNFDYEDISTLSAIRFYKNAGSKRINLYLRDEKDKIENEYPIEKIKQTIKRLRNIINEREYNVSLSLFRGDDYSALDNITLSSGEDRDKKLSEVLQELSQLNNEEEINKKLDKINSNGELTTTQPSFLSTSLSASGHKSTKPIQWKFTTKGTINGAALDIPVKTSHRDEMEFLLKEKTKINIKHISYKDSQWLIDAELSQ